jgi:HSP20 family protein
MNLVNWTPFRDMEGFFDRYNNLMASRAGPGAETGKAFDWRPSVDISETKTDYLIKVVLPDVEKEDVEVSIENGLLTISGERKLVKEDETETQHRVESLYGSFSRSFTLPTDTDENNISAKSKNGVLKVRIPKIQETVAKPVQIAVE